MGIGAGVIQGGILSPDLFVITFNTLMQKLKKEGMDIFAYADDLVITQNGKIKMKKTTKIIEEWARNVEMQINKKKSAIMYIRKNKRGKKMIEKFEEQENNIHGYPLVREYKYLGIIFDETLTFENHLNKIMDKI